MKRFTLRLLLIISAIIGAIFSFWYLIDHQIYMPQLSDISIYTRFINHGLFIVSLFLLLFAFFINEKLYKITGVFLMICGLLYLTHVFSFIDANYFYLIPLFFYILTGFIMYNEKLISKKRYKSN